MKSQNLFTGKYFFNGDLAILELFLQNIMGIEIIIPFKHLKNSSKSCNYSYLQTRPTFRKNYPLLAFMPCASSRHSQRQKAGREKLHVSPISISSCPWILLSEEAVEILQCLRIGTVILPVSHGGSVGRFAVLNYGCRIIHDSACLHQIQVRVCRSCRILIQYGRTLWKTHPEKKNQKHSKPTPTKVPSLIITHRRILVFSVALEACWYLVVMRILSMPKAGNCCRIKVGVSVKLLSIIY